MLNCDFKSYRCKSCYLPIIENLDFIKSFTLRKELIDREDIKLVYGNTFMVLFFNIVHFVRTIGTLRLIYKTSALQKLFISKWFTKVRNVEKLFLNSHQCFLSSGMVLKLTETYKKNLKRRFVSWKLFILVYKKMFLKPTIIWFNNIFGQKLKLLEFMLYKDVKIFWCFIRIFYLNFTSNTRTPRRIKKWVQKKINRNRVDVW